MRSMFLTLVIHIILGYRELADLKFYNDDPLVLRVLGLRRLPSTATRSRRLRSADMATIVNLKRMSRTLILHCLVAEKLRRDRDGVLRRAGSCSPRRCRFARHRYRLSGA